ncbi:hypothetical protein [Shewanella chilikensis]|jgi:hypothetical protein|uniref:hypothetical protein n=1 Tax=Shewanella chilikensis TaxID=558541 RepID=UPI003A96B761
MKMPKLLLSLVCALALSGCIDVSLDFDLKSEQLDIRTLQGADTGKPGPNPNKNCEQQGGSLTSHADGSTVCHHVTQFSIDTWLQEGKVSFIDIGSTEKSKPMPIDVETEDEGVIKLTLDVNTFISEFNEDMFPPDMPAEMQQAMIKSLKEEVGSEGFHIAFTGEQVKDTNGSLSNNGKTVTFNIPMLDIIDPANKQSPDTYTAVIRVDEMPEKLLAPVTFSDSEVRKFISSELDGKLPVGWQAVVVTAEIAENKVSMVSDYIINDTAHRFMLPDSTASENALLKLHNQMSEDGLGWRKAKLTLKPEGSLRIEPLD